MQKFTNILNESNKYKYNKIIDFTYLRNDANIEKIRSICNEAKHYGFWSVCIKPDYVVYAKQFLKDSDVKVCTVVSFPNGSDKTTDKLKEIESTLSDGADEIDMVMNYDLLKKTLRMDDEDKNKNIDYIKNEIRKSVEACHGIHSVTIKVIVESGNLTYDQLKVACDICAECGVDFVKTSTGTKKIGAELDKVRFMRKILPDYIKIKAAGGIRTLEDIHKFVKAGADRVGTSSNPYLLS